MNIRTRLLLQFSLFVFIIISIFSSAILYFSSTYRSSDYYSRLENRALSTAQLLLNVDEVSADLLRIIDKNTLSLYNENLRIYTEDSTEVYANLSDSTVSSKLYLLPQVVKNQRVEYRDGEREGLGLLVVNKGKNYIILVSAWDKYGLSKISNLKIILLTGFLFSIFTAIIFGYVFAGRALKPISNVINQVKTISVNNLNQRVNEGNKKDEIAQMAITFNQMLQRLEDAFILQREFVANAAHELRTPFTVMVTELDYTLMQERDKEKYKAVIKSLSEELKKLSKLSNGLLDLARISFEKSPADFKLIRMDELLIETYHSALQLRPHSQIELNLDQMPENEQQLLIYGNEQLLSISFNNLIDNACKFSENNGVKIGLHIEDTRLHIDFKDQGTGIHTKDLDKIFQPFYRGQNSQYIAGYGIGLALTKKIVELHDGTVNVVSVLGKGSTFRISLPVSI
ncbi:MAG TPA: ATP-binding protein [Saprospiraceae bacterium]|nr:ATP-binding protein [Saprospiraceae bacterium]HRG64924.1 ATP-binding protein [Saprospiraceae bacterium]